MIGLLGAHRTGKSTLMFEVSKQSHYKVAVFGISTHLKQIGYDSTKQDYSFEEVMQKQEHLLNAFKAFLENLQMQRNVLRVVTEYISDRTPLDLIGYVMVHANDSLTDNQSTWLLSYIQRCIELTNRYYSKLVLIQPGIDPIKDNDTSAEPILGFMEHLNAIYLSYMIDNRVTPQKLIMPRDLIDLQQRVEFIL